jgi:hypothetical protein
VASISPVLVSSDGNGVVDGSRPDPLPSNLWLTWEAQNSGITANVERLRDAATAAGNPPPKVLPVDTMHHSRQLVLNHAEVRDFLTEAITSCTASP